MRVLLVEDDEMIGQSLREALTRQGWSVDWVKDGVLAQSALADGGYACVLLDLGLPRRDGVEVLRRARAAGETTPVVVLTARDALPDRVTGLDAGADDYLVKPFSLVELEIRLKALMRRSHGLNLSSAVSYADVSFDPDTLEATRAGKPLQLTPTGYKLLSALLREAPKLVRREDLEREVWGNDPPDSDALRTHIHALRSALDKPFPVPLLKTHPGIGYRLVSPDAG